MYVRRPWWQHSVTEAILLLGLPILAMVLLGNRLSHRPPTVAVPVGKRSQADFAALDRLVTIVPPKTRKTLVTRLEGKNQSAPFFRLDESPTSQALVNSLHGVPTLPASYVRGKFAAAFPTLVAQAAKAGFKLVSGGWDDRDPNTMTREELDSWFKATNRSIFEATGKRPEIYFHDDPEHPPTQQVVDFAAINGMVTYQTTGGSGQIPLVRSVEELRAFL